MDGKSAVCDPDPIDRNFKLKIMQKRTKLLAAKVRYLTYHIWPEESVLC
jgi:hypothetical protein